MLIKIQNIEDENQELEDEVEDLRRRIAKQLKDEQEGKLQAQEAHQQAVDKLMAGNQKASLDLKALLFTFQELPKDDED